VSYSELAKIAEEEFFDVVLYTQIIAGKLRLHIVDGSYLDVWFSVNMIDLFKRNLHDRPMGTEHENVFSYQRNNILYIIKNRADNVVGCANRMEKVQLL